MYSRHVSFWHRSKRSKIPYRALFFVVTLGRNYRGRHPLKNTIAQQLLIVHPSTPHSTHDVIASLYAEQHVFEFFPFCAMVNIILRSGRIHSQNMFTVDIFDKFIFK